MKKKLLVLGSGLIMSMGVLASCGPKKAEDGYTYNTYLQSSPKNWNVHSWETSDESYIGSFCEMGLYDCILNETKDGYVFVSEMASDLPTAVAPEDLTEQEATTYWEGNATAGMVWDIPLNRAATWEDGTAITAQDYVDSMELQLSPKYANYRADSYFGSNLVLCNAENYYKQGRATNEPFFKYYDEKTGEVENDSGLYYLNLGKYTPFLDLSYGEGATDKTFGDILGQLDDNSVKLPALRIKTAYQYYLQWYKDHSNLTSWDRAYDKTTHLPTKPSDVTDNNIKEDIADIEIMVFDEGFTDFTGQKNYIKTVKNVTDGWVEANIEAYTREALERDLSAVVKFIGNNRGVYTKSWAWKLPLFTPVFTYKGKNIEFTDVGIRKVDDYKIRLYLSRAITELNLKFALSGNWLVNVPLYKQLSKPLGKGNSLATTYASGSVANYKSYGPYKLTYFAAGDKITIERNDKWYGWKDGKHVGQFQMDRIVTKIIPQHQNALLEFMAGRLDDIDLTVNDFREYGSSGRVSTTYESYTQKISFNTKRDSLKARQSDTPNTNKTILANQDFRTGLSLAINRNDFASQATSGSKGFTGLLNDLYLSNNSTGETYRSTPQGKSVYDLVYGKLGGDEIGENVALSERQCGFNYSLAVKYAVKALKEELTSSDAGHIKANDKINIEFRVYDNESENTIAAHTYITQQWAKLINDAVTALKADGTLGQSDKIEIAVKMEKDQDYYTTARNGGYDMIFSTWGGAAVNPYGLMEVYAKKDFTNCCEYGFMGQQDKFNLGIDADGDGTIDATDTDSDGMVDSGSECKSFHAWYTYMVDSDDCNEAQYGDGLIAGDENYEEWLEAHTRKLNVLAGLEAGIINRYEAIPLVARGTSSLNGFKTENATDNYVSLVGYGGIRFLKFNYTDSEWAKFCSQYNNDLSDAYKSYEKGEN